MKGESVDVAFELSQPSIYSLRSALFITNVFHTRAMQAGPHELWVFLIRALFGPETNFTRSSSSNGI
jgi:hypothetical protein